MLIYWTYRLASWLLPVLPQVVLPLAAQVGGAFAYVVNGRGRRYVLSNLRHVLGPTVPESQHERIARQVFITAAANYLDLFRLSRLSLGEIAARVQYIGLEHFERAYASGRGVVLFGPHVGSIDVAVQLLAERQVPVVVLAERLQPPVLFELVRSLRAGRGVRIEALGYSGLRQAIEALRRGEVVAVLADRDVNGRGSVVLFCGEAAQLPLGMVELALRRGAVLLPAFALRQGGGRYLVTVEPPLELGPEASPELLRQEAARVLERFVRAYPEQWVVFEPVWNS